jgi:peptidoglycan/xylan/chitin deacetylase (PgdA/CDA1 family)
MQIENAAILKAIFSLKGNLAQGGRPPRKVVSGIEVAPFKNNAAAASCITADFELGWGWRSRGLEGAEVMAQQERRHVPLILSLLEEFLIPITWATVGHLFLENCTCSGTGVAHPEMPRPVTDGTWSGDWYFPDPCSNLRKAPSWYAPDLIQMIAESRVPHEIGTHSFSHIDFRAAYSSPDVVERELEACIELMRPLGLRPRTLVFPRNKSEYAYLSLLAKAGVVVVRHRDREDGIRLAYPERTPDGVYKVYESMNLRIAKHYSYLEKTKMFVREAMKRHAVYALWFHPSDPTEWFEPQLREILTYMDSERRNGRLWVTTMQELAAYCEAREQLQLNVRRSEDTLTVEFETALDTARFGAPDVTLLLPSSTQPKSAWFELAGGERMPAIVRSVTAGPQRLMVNVPTNAKALEFRL